MARKVLPIKLVTERYTVVFDFLDELAWGDLVDTASVEVVPEVGVDALPQEMLYKLPVVVDGRYVKQQVWWGVPGVVYQLKCEARTVANIPLEAFVRLAILPDTASIPLFNATFLTSLPYPVEDSEGFRTFFVPTAGRLINKAVNEIPEVIYTLFVPMSGNLIGGREAYVAPPEALVTEFSPISGELFGDIVSYDAKFEGFDTALLPLSGTLVGGRVTYNNAVEGMSTAFLPLSGTLT